MAGAAGSSAAPSSGSATTKVANELIFGADTVGTGNLAPGSSFTTRILTSPGFRSGGRSRCHHGRSLQRNRNSYVQWSMGHPDGGLEAGGFRCHRGCTHGEFDLPKFGSDQWRTAVTITGANFVSGATVSFGGTAASSVTVVSGTSITATTPAHAAGAVNVVVTDSNGSGTLSQWIYLYRYSAHNHFDLPQFRIGQ